MGLKSRLDKVLFENVDVKRVFIIHGWNGNPDQHWLPWMEEELEQRGVDCQIPSMPNPSNPDMDEWLKAMEDAVGEVDENTFFVGHSIGCQAILRFLATQSNLAGGLVLVAPWTKLSEDSIADMDEDDKKVLEQWSSPIEWDKINAEECIALFSNDDEVVPLDNKDIFDKELGAKVIELEDRGHFTADEGVSKLPEALEELVDLMELRDGCT